MQSRLMQDVRLSNEKLHAKLPTKLPTKLPNAKLHTKLPNVTLHAEQPTKLPVHEATNEQSALPGCSLIEAYKFRGPRALGILSDMRDICEMLLLRLS